MSDEVNAILALMTRAELGLYAAAGGEVPPSLWALSDRRLASAAWAGVDPGGWHVPPPFPGRRGPDADCKLLADRERQALRDLGLGRPPRRAAARVAKPRRGGRPVVCVERPWLRFPHLKAAASALGVNTVSLKRAVDHGWRCGGLHWREMTAAESRQGRHVA